MFDVQEEILINACQFYPDNIPSAVDAILSG